PERQTAARELQPRFRRLPPAGGRGAGPPRTADGGVSRERSLMTPARRARGKTGSRRGRNVSVRRIGARKVATPKPVAEQAVALNVNGKRYVVTVPVRRTLADVLREDLGLTGTHLGCEHGVCGACTILLDGQAVRSCLLLGVQADGHLCRCTGYVNIIKAVQLAAARLRLPTV